MEQLLGWVLQLGVLLAAAVALFGGLFYVFGHAMQAADYRVFQGEPADVTTLGGIVRGAWHLNSRDIVQLGVLILLATPITRVSLSALAFACQRDRTYLIVTALVLALLLASLLTG